MARRRPMRHQGDGSKNRYLGQEGERRILASGVAPCAPARAL